MWLELGKYGEYVYYIPAFVATKRVQNTHYCINKVGNVPTSHFKKLPAFVTANTVGNDLNFHF